MDKYRLQWAGAPCGQHGAYTFYKAVKYYKNGRWRIVSLGEFFFLKFSETDPLCIGELQLLWEDRSADGLMMLSSSRFYYLPESTPDGRKQHHGEDEVIAVDGNAIFKLEDLMDWVCTDVEWNRGSVAICSKDVKGGPLCDNNNGQLDDFALNNSKLNYADVKQEKKLLGDDDDKGQVKILSFPGYCRYKTILKRLEKFPDGWLNDALVRALGGFTVPHRGTRLMYCKEEFEHPSLGFHEKLCDHLAPNLKGRPRKKKLTSKEKEVLITRRISEDDSASIPDTTKVEEEKEKQKEKKPKHKSKKRNKKNKCKRGDREESGVKVHLDSESSKDKKEREVVKRGRKSMESHLLAFMKSRNTPITRVPNLGFKKINIGLFWKVGQKLGGYEAICKKKLWKKIYDKLGGSPESTSAATCTRRHYEKLILPYERHLKGLGHLPLPKPYQRPKSKDEEEQTEGNEEATNANVYDWQEGSTSDENKDEEKTNKSDEDAEDDETARQRKALKALKKKQQKPKERAKKLKDQLKEIREKNAQMSLQPISTKDGLLLSGLNLPPTATSVNTTTPSMPGIMTSNGVLLPNVPPGQVPSSLAGLRPITVTTGGGGAPGGMGPVILTIPSLHSPPHLMNPLPAGVIAANPVKTEASLSSSSSCDTKRVFTPHMMNGMSGVITRAPMIPTNTSAAASQPPSVSESQVIKRASQAESRLPVSLPLPLATHSKTKDTARSQISSLPGATITLRPSVMQHTQHARIASPYMPGSVHPNNLILRNLSPRKAQAVKPADKPESRESKNGPDPIIVTPMNPCLPRFPGMPPMMLPGQIPFPHPALHEPPLMNAKRRRTESGKENLDDKLPSTSLPHQMPFYPVSVPMPVPRLVPPPFQSLPEQDEPCDLSMPKKRKHDGHSEERPVIKERKHDNSPMPHFRSVHGSKYKSVLDYPSDLFNHRTHKVDERHHHSIHGRVPATPVPPVADYLKLHSPVKMTPRPRGSITQGVINPPINSIAKVHRESSSSSSSSSVHAKRDATSHISHTSSFTSLPSDHHRHHQDKGQMLVPEFPSPHLLAAAAATGFPPRCPLPLVPPHLLSPPQLLAGLPPPLPLNEELLRRRAGAFVVPPLRYPPPGLVGGGLSPSPVKKEGQPVFAFQS